jgi:hypothetical protein
MRHCTLTGAWCVSRRRVAARRFVLAHACSIARVGKGQGMLYLSTTPPPAPVDVSQALSALLRNLAVPLAPGVAGTTRTLCVLKQGMTGSSSVGMSASSGSASSSSSTSPGTSMTTAGATASAAMTTNAVNASGDTPLHVAARNNQEVVCAHAYCVSRVRCAQLLVRFLLSQPDVSVDAPDATGLLPAQCAPPRSVVETLLLKAITGTAGALCCSTL